MWDLPESTRIVDVGLRDGLQTIEAPLSTEQKLSIVERLIAAGVTEIEVASFAHPRVLPQLADAEELLARVPRPPHVRYRALVPNTQGASRAAACDIDEVVFVIPADDELARRNQNRSTDQLLVEAGKIREIASSAGQQFTVAIASAFFAPCRGPVPAADRLRVVDGALSAGAESVYLAATTGQENPREFYEGFCEVRDRYPDISFGAHLHNRNGFAPANALAALSAGATWLEASFSGLGGDAWFPGDPTVLGNMPTEDLLHLLDAMGIATGIDLSSYRRLAEDVTALTRFPTVSFVARGGTREDLAQASWPDDD